MIEIQSPNEYVITSDPVVFLAGSIEMGVAENWQRTLIDSLHDFRCTLLNPRRDDFNVLMLQRESNPDFAEQVNWELDGINDADIVIFYLDPNTKSPISLMELGFVAAPHHSKKVIVCCPEGFYRLGNVEVMCNRFGLELVHTLDELIDSLKTDIIAHLCKESHIQSILDRNEAAESKSQWNPIETAPLDGTVVDLYVLDHPRGFGGSYFEDGKWTNGKQTIYSPSHWQPSSKKRP